MKDNTVTDPFAGGGRVRRESRLPGLDPLMVRFVRRLRTLGATTDQLEDVAREWPALDLATRAALATAPDDVLRDALAGRDPLLDDD